MRLAWLRILVAAFFLIGSTAAAQVEFGKDLRDDPSLPRAERMRRHRLRLELLRKNSREGRLSDGTVFWNFERDKGGWRAGDASIAVERVERMGAASPSKACLRIRGPVRERTGHAVSSRSPIRAGREYRLSAWVRVDSPAAARPFLALHLADAKGNPLDGRRPTAIYDGSRRGQWQRLSATYRTPAEARACTITLETGACDLAEVDAYVDDVRLDPVAVPNPLDDYRLDPLPKPLVEHWGVHPRLYLDAARIAELRKSIDTSHASVWKQLEQQARQFMEKGPPAYRRDSREQLWQRESSMAVPSLALAYLMTGDRQYAESARTWMLASCSYPTWGLGNVDGMDMAAGQQLFGLGIGYDWLYDTLDADARRRIRETLARRGWAMFAAAANYKVWWSGQCMQNHNLANYCGMAIAGLAVCDEITTASAWVGLALQNFRRTMEGLGPDGIWHAGPAYWTKSTEHMLEFMYPARELLGVDLFDHPWLRNTAMHQYYLSVPRAAWRRYNYIVDFGDSSRGLGADFLLRALAREYRDGQAQWLVEEIERAKIQVPFHRWLNFLWHDPTVQPQRPTDLPTLRHYENMGIVVARSDWSSSESLVFFKCGPVVGHHAIQTFDFDPGGSHVHPDANHFVLIGKGAWLIRDNGYSGKMTDQHNTLLIDGKGQTGEGATRLRGILQIKAKARPRVTRANSTPELDHIAGDATEAYPPESGLRRFARHLLFLKPDVLIVADDISVNTTRSLELRFHPEARAGRLTDGGIHTVSGGMMLRVDPLTPDTATFSAGNLPAHDKYGRSRQKMYTIRLHTRRRLWRNAVALSWSKSKTEPVRVKLERNADVWRFTAGDRAVELDWTTGQSRFGN